jgi:hypothetical protein
MVVGAWALPRPSSTSKLFAPTDANRRARVARTTRMPPTRYAVAGCGHERARERRGWRVLLWSLRSI